MRYDEDSLRDWLDLQDERAQEHGVNNPERTERPAPAWFVERVAAIEAENVERIAAEASRRKEREEVGLCEHQECVFPRMENGTECQMHFRRGQY